MSDDSSELKINNSFRNGEPVEFLFDYIDSVRAGRLVEALKSFLDEICKSYLKEETAYILNELITNANKSNIKRVYFLSSGLNILDPQNYSEGMKNFSSEFGSRLKEFENEFIRLGFYTKVIFQNTGKHFYLSVINSNCATSDEIGRIHRLVNESKRVRNVVEAYINLMDSSEGAGLGIVTMMIMLRGMGMPEDSYEFSIDPIAVETRVKIDLRLDAVTESQMASISETIVSEIDALPPFPENISRLEKMMTSGELVFGQIANVIQTDPSLTADLLRLVNSARYMLNTRVSSIVQALYLIGIKALKDLLIFYGAQHTLVSRYGTMEKEWEHSYRTASYAYHLASDFNMKSLADDAYTGGILHDIGKLILMHAHPGLIEKIGLHFSGKGFDSSIIENLAVGLSHDKIGSQVVKKWNFPEIIADMIGFHHHPLLAPDESRKLVYVVYLANLMAHYHDNGYFPGLPEQDVIKFFSIKEMDGIINLEKKYDAYYMEQKKKSEIA